MGEPRFGWKEIPLARGIPRHPRDRVQIGPIDAPILHSPSAVNMGNPHAMFWVDDVEAYELEKFGPLLENHPIFPERANISLAAVIVARSHHHAHLGARRRVDAGLRLRGVRGCGRGRAAASARRRRVSLPGGTHHRMARRDNMC